MEPKPSQRASIVQRLKELGVNHRLLNLGDEAYTVEDVVRLGRVPRDEVCKTLLFVEKSGGTSVLVLVPGDSRVDIERVETVTGLKLRLASPREVKGITGYEVGALPPFGHRTLSLTLVDERLMLKEMVNFGTGIHDTGAEMSPGDFARVMTFRVANISRR